MLTQYTRYALRALLHLAANPRAEPHPVAEIAAQTDIPRKFLETILADLKRCGLVASTRGQRGGYRLAHAAAAISCGDVIRRLDSPLGGLFASGDDPAGAAAGDALDQGLDEVMRDAGRKMAEMLDATSLAAVLERAEAARRRSSEAFDYSI